MALHTVVIEVLQRLIDRFLLRVRRLPSLVWSVLS